MGSTADMISRNRMKQLDCKLCTEYFEFPMGKLVPSSFADRSFAVKVKMI